MNSPAPAQPPATRRKRTWLNPYTIGLAAIAVLAPSGYLTWRHFWGQPSELDRYQFATVQRGDIEDLVTATGTLQPRDYVDVGAQVSGQLKKIHVEIGSVVQAGDLLAEIDPTVYLATVDARRAALRNLHATMTGNQSNLALAKLQLERQRNLAAGDATTTESLQAAEAAVRAAKAQVDALQAQIEQSESSLRADEANLNYARIYSPISGVVVSISARQGQTLNSSQQAPTLLRVADLSTMTVQTQVSEADIGQLRPSMDVYFTTLGNRGRRWSGNLRKVEPTPTVTNNVVLYNALFDVANDQRNLLPQMTAQVFFVAASAKDALTVPASAVTLQRQNADRRGGFKGGDHPASGASSTASSASSATGHAPASAASPSTAPASATSRPHRERPAPADEAQRASEPRRGPPDGMGAGNPMAQMSPEERRAMFERMNPEERAAMRERMRAMREARENQAADAPPPAEPRASSRPPRQASASAPAGQPPQAQVWAGVSPARARMPREGTVKVVSADGQVEERKVQVGISNRVQVQILAGLREGEKVVAGVKPPPSANRNDAQRNALQGQGGMPPGMGPGGPTGAPNAAGGARAR
jgi:macrolide-specific efflux system membrane fusion protein